ncbi:MAG: translation elongation factor Ts [Firmicutes bacterium]|uniref:Elongation factor Ts n=1 Tax=Sulfobacillus benefaciens TaxID=453960 RepID=A0A2T2XB13_9FIRM|nr:translation elongation factor Ts [Bacillota bacterium]MCL5015831.1 translation elongation factor Ts [Bacillota bacterium]PSR31713.1 MAG: elongation factor Ts [Sulfobacillus benefaciens]HBQ95632.1 elongation factor Ts [Sulfobacillus sp.]
MISANDVKKLREMTGAGMMECKKALQEANGDFERAIDILRERGLAQAAKKAGREANEGLIESYIHLQGRIGVLLEINCETDFVANTPDFHTLAHDIAMHIAASNPRFVNRDQVPADVVEHEKRVLSAQAENEGKPPAIIEKMVAGRIEKFYKDVCLVDQPFIKNPDVTVDQLLKEHIARLGEHIVVRRFVRFERGEELLST